jgi:hypothetical protein
MKTITILIFSFFLLIYSNATQAAACYTPAEAEADQGIRIHSELMVIGLNCQQIGKKHGDNLYGTYRQMTAKYANLFGGYENVLMSFFKKAGRPNPEGSLNELRTRYANKISVDAASMRPDIFCSRYADRVKQAAKMSEAGIRKWASTFHASHPVSYPLCGGGSGKAAKPAARR